MQPGSVTYPLRGDYVDALQHPAFALADPALRLGEVQCNTFGIPDAISGNFASVFKVSTPDSRRWAVKCFCQQVPDQERRYQAITSALASLGHPALVEFQYQADGILVAGRRYPILKMQWLEAKGLLPWIEANRFDARRLQLVAEQVISLVNDLEQAGIAHGDLQHGNLLVTANDQLRLIDYDGMFVPALLGLPACEKGLANYQSPGRQDYHFQPGLDRFAGWVIYASLIALSEAPFLWTQLRVDGDEKLLFDARDYANPRGSQALQRLRAIGLPNLAQLADTVTAIAQTPVEAIPALAAQAVVSHNQPATSRVPSQGARTGLPSWLDPPMATQAVAAVPPNLGGATADGSWLQEHLPPLPRHSFRGGTSVARRAFASVLLYLTVVSLAAVAVVGLSAVALALVGLIVLLLTYRSHPLAADSRAVNRMFKDARKARLSTERDLARFERERARIDTEHGKRQAARGQLRTQASSQLRQQVATIEQTLRHKLAVASNERSAIDLSEQKLRGDRLEQLKRAHLSQHLSQVRLVVSPPPGIGEQLLDRLGRSGIRTAADFTSYVVSGSARTRNEQAHIQLASGRRVHVDGIGKKKADALVQWRQRAIAHAQRTQPTRLSQADEQQLQTELTAKRDRAARNAADAKSLAQQEQQVARQREQAQLRSLDQEDQADATQYLGAVQGIDRATGEVRQRLTACHVAAGEQERLAKSYSKIGLARFARFAAVGR